MINDTFRCGCTAYVGGFVSVYPVPLTTGAAVAGPEELRPWLMGLPQGEPWEPHLCMGLP